MHRVIGHTTLERVKTLLWAVMGVWAVVTVARFGHGIGATSGLTDSAPWGFWIAFDVMAGVALAAGGFVIAAGVYIFGLARYHSLARPAILTALLGYMAVAVGLLYTQEQAFRTIGKDNSQSGCSSKRSGIPVIQKRERLT